MSAPSSLPGGEGPRPPSGFSTWLDYLCGFEHPVVTHHLRQFPNYEPVSASLCARAELEALRRVADKNYADLLDRFDEVLGSCGKMSAAEIRALIESRRVHKPAAASDEEAQ